MLFSAIVGQQQAKNNLMQMERRGQLPHALLLLGREGAGGLPFALAFSQYLLCENKQPDDACGVCAACQKAARLEHADLHLSFPTIPPKPGVKAQSRHYIKEFREFVAQTPYGTTYDWLQAIQAENKQGNLSAEECREIIDTLNLKSYEGGRKIQIIWRPEYLGKEGNILLKLIEEPPADTLLLLVAEEAEDILPTILSRTQLVRLPPLSAAGIAAALAARGLADDRRAAQIGQLAGGSYTEALRLLQHMGNDLLPALKDWFNALFTNSGPGLTRFAEEWSKAGREGQKHFLQYVTDLLGHSLRATYLPGTPPALPPEEAEFVRKIAARRLPLPVLEKMIGTLAETGYHIERNAHGKTQLLTLSIHLQHLIQGREVLIG